MQHTSRVSPCYPYRYKTDAESDEDYSQRLGDELEEEVLRVGPGKVAAFFAETGRSWSSERQLIDSWWSSSRQFDSGSRLFQGYQEGLRQVWYPVGAG
jgi:hypothetical protein